MYEFQDGSFDDFCELFIEGLIEYGDYFKWILSWLPHRHDDNVLFVTYEGMKAKPEENVKKIGTFIGVGDKLESNPQFISDVVNGSSVKNMQEVINPSFRTMLNMKDESGKETFNFVRKGVVNDWKSIMSDEQSNRISEKFRQTAQEHPELMSLWDDYSWL